MRYKMWFILLAALLLVACSKEPDQTVTPTPAPTPTPGGPSTNPDNPDDPQQPVEPDGDPMWLVAATRATGTELYDVVAAGETQSPIQIFLIASPNENETEITYKREGMFAYDADPSVPGWSSTIGLKNRWNCIYGFSPANAASCAISPVSGTSYHNGAVLKMTKVGAASGDDLCVIVGVKNSSAPNTDVPSRGQYVFEKGNDNYISLLLDHVFARLDFKVKVGTKYGQRRHVKIKKLELQSAYELKDVTIRLTPDATDIQYNTAVVPAGADNPTGVVYDFTEDPENKEGKALTTEGTIFPGYFAPDDDGSIAKGLSLICTYDVYIIDNNNKIGSRVGENRVAVNSLAGIDLSALTRGKKTTLVLTVEPTYLYQISDDELDNPSISLKVED